MASLYVGDLQPEVNEAILYQKFMQLGNIVSIRVCRDSTTKLSLGYAYVNFQSTDEAEAAMDALNFELLNNRPMRIMWSQRDPSTRRSGAGNIFIKNLDKSVDTKSLYDTFSLFGKILSCKVACDEGGASKGYGFVHFENEEGAQKAIDKVNGMLLNDKKVFVGKFLPREQRRRELGDTAYKFTNVFVKNFGDKLDKEALEKLFGKYGEITSSALMTNEDGKSKGFGFVAFKNAEDANKAVEALHEFPIEGSDLKLYVGRAQKKEERKAELRKKFQQAKAEKMKKIEGANVYVKNIDDTVTDEELRALFAPIGPITSAKVMTNEAGRSKGFGFVCFENNEHAKVAVQSMGSKMVNGKPLYVTFAQRKEDRSAFLASQYMKRLRELRPFGPESDPSYMGQATGGSFYQTRGIVPRPAAAGQRAYQTGFVPTAVPMQQRRGGPTMQPNIPRAMPTQQRPRFPVTGQPGLTQPMNRGPVPQGNMRYVQQPQQQQYPQQQHQNMYKTPYQQYPQHMQQQQHPQVQRVAQQGTVINEEDQLTTEMLAAANPQEQKQLLGERIYALIEKEYSSSIDAGKLTGMMLEIDNADLILLISDREQFKAKVEEANKVLLETNKQAV